MAKINHDDVLERLKGLQIEYQDLKEAEKKLIEVIAPLTEIDKAERKLAQLYAKLEETWNASSEGNNIT